MSSGRRVRSAARWTAAACGLAAAGYGVCVAAAWLGYGRASRGGQAEADPLLDQVMPAFDVAERHHIEVAAAAATTFAAAASIDLNQSWPVRLIFRLRELVMGSASTASLPPEGFRRQMQRIGWGVLAETPGREVVMGAVTQPWLADVVFRPLPPQEFIRFNEPGYVKIAWTLRADALGGARSVFRTETRVVSTDAGARAKFRRYWSLAAPGIIFIRWLMLRAVKKSAERGARPLRRSSAA